LSTRVVKIGPTAQLITTTYTEESGIVHEHITLETPAAITDTQRLRLMRSYELNGRDWRTE
jgi:hypothetical protein